MTCPALERIAAAASGAQASGSVAADANAAIVLAHAVACPRCAELLREQREVRGFATRLPVPALDRDRRAELAAEVMARADAAPGEKRALRLAIGASIAVAAVATIAIVLAMRSTDEQPVATAPARSPSLHQPTRAKPAPVAIDRAPLPRAPDEPVIEVSTGAKLTRTLGATERVVLAEGNVTVDARSSRDVAVTAGTTQVAVGRAKATVTAKRGVIESVHVFAGSVEVTSNGKKRVVSAGTVWHSTDLLEPRPELPKPESVVAPEPPPSASELSLQAFRQGYVALRAGRNADAIAAFDRATDPVVAEDAMFWAAVASDRFGDRDDAIRRYTAFLARFPGSPRAGDARAAIARLETPPSAPEPKGL